MTWLSADPERAEIAAERAHRAYAAEHPLIAEIYRVAAVVMEIAAPVLWSVLILMGLWAAAFLR